MALVLKDRVKETTTTTGTGTYTLAGAVVGYQAFSVIGNANTTYYAITNGTDWEVGLGTYTLSGTTLSRDTILESSNSGNAVNWGAGVKDIFCTYPAERSMYVDGSTITPATAASLAVVSGGTGQTSYTDGQLLIGNSTGNTLAKATLTAGTGISVTNGAGSITVAAINNGTVTSVSGTGSVNGITLTGTVTSSGSLTLGGTLSNVSLTTQVTGTLPAGNGGTGITSLGSGVATWLGTPSSTNLRAAVTDETGTGSLVFATSPTLVTPVLGTPTSGNLNNCTADGTNKVGYRNIPSVADKTTSYSLTTGDIGKVVRVGSGGSITIPNSTFAAGDAVLIFNNTAGDITITCTITTAYIAGTDADVASVTLATRGVCNILFLSGTACVLTGNIA